jgi:SynChlorMet cassette radical SAM/SPASM protein ScmF
MIALNDKENGSQMHPPLSSIYFYLTEGCNLACRHCWIGPRFSPKGEDPGALSIDLFGAAIREAKPLGLRSIKLTGGEPLLHPDIHILLNIIRCENLGLSIETNGVLCTSGICRDLAKMRIKQVAVSIDGVDAETHEWLRGVPGSFAKAVQGIENLVSAGIRPQVIMSLVRRNSDQIEEMIRMAEKLGVSSVKFNIVQPTARGENLFESGETLGISELIDLGGKVERLKSTTPLGLIFSYPLAFRPLKAIMKMSYLSGCNIHSIIGVIASGHYALCGIGSNEPDLVFGKVGDNVLQDIWRTNKVLNDLRTGLPGRLSGVCQRCVMKPGCKGYCRAHSYYRTGNLWSPDMFCEQAEKIGLFPKSRII